MAWGAIRTATPTTRPVFTGTAERATGPAVRERNRSRRRGRQRHDRRGASRRAPCPTATAMTATATDAAGNTSLLSSGLSITIDTTPPATPAAPTRWRASDSCRGREETGDNGARAIPDRDTNDTTPVFLELPPKRAATVRLYANGTEVGDVVANAMTDAWSITSNTLSDGAYTMTATATDAAGKHLAALQWPVDHDRHHAAGDSGRSDADDGRQRQLCREARASPATMAWGAIRTATPTTPLRSSRAPPKRAAWSGCTQAEPRSATWSPTP